MISKPLDQALPGTPPPAIRGRAKLTPLTPDRFTELSKETITYADSTLKKHKWSLGLYSGTSFQCHFPKC